MLVSGRPRALRINTSMTTAGSALCLLAVTAGGDGSGGVGLGPSERGSGGGRGQARGRAGYVPLARAGLLPRPRRLPDWEHERKTPHDGRMVDALALAAEEGRGHAAKCPGEALAA